MRVEIELNEADMRRLVADQIARVTGFGVPDKDIVILVKTKANFKAEWEAGDFKAVYKSFATEVTDACK